MLVVSLLLGEHLKDFVTFVGMCTLTFAINEHPDYPFILMGNRDEFYNRPTAPMHWWNDVKSDPQEAGDMLAGKDLKAGGTWMGVTAGGKFAAITNFRDLNNVKSDAPSRGKIVNEYLQSQISPEEYLKQLQTEGPDYNGFNLLFGSFDELYYYSNYGRSEKGISNGVHGISNAFLNDSWAKVDLAKARLSKTMKSDHLESNQLMRHLGDQKEFHRDLPETGVSKELEKKLSAICIVTPDYGTRVSTTILVHKSGRVEVNELNRLTGEEEEFVFHRGYLSG